MQRLLAVLLVLLGLIGLALGRLGETTWAPATEVTATVELNDPGPAVVIDPGVLYIGDETGEVSITAASEVSVITAGPGDIEAYLDGVAHTRVTGASDWSTLSTEAVNAEGETELTSPTSSDLWRSVETAPSPFTLDIAEFRTGETGENQQPYRALLIVTDGSAPGAETISVTWPVEAENEWVPLAYAGGAAVAVIGLVLLVVSLGSGRRRESHDDESVESGDVRPEGAGAVAPALPSTDDTETTATVPPSTDDTETLDAVGDDTPSADDGPNTDDGLSTDDRPSADDGPRTEDRPSTEEPR